jgi:capsular polysaccharide biosynthesis protein
MDLQTMIGILIRRWIIVIPTIILAVLVTVMVAKSVDPSYESKGSMLVIANVERDPDTNQIASNPYRDQPASLRTTSAALADVLSSDQFRRQISQSGLSTDYDVTLDDESPIILITARSPSRDIAIDTARELLTQAGTQLNLREAAAGVPAELQLKTDVLDTPIRAKVVDADRTKAILALVVLSVIAVVTIALVSENFAAHRERKNRRAVEDDEAFSLLFPPEEEPADKGVRALRD